MILRLLFTVSIFFILTSQIVQGQTYSEQTRELVTQFPNDDGELDWQSLGAQAGSNVLAAASFEDVYVESLIALRTGRIDLIENLATRAKSTASTDAEVAQAAMLGTFLEFYLFDPDGRTEHAEHLLDRISDLQDAGRKSDWLTGTTISALVEHASQVRDLALAERMSAQAERLFSRDPELKIAIWVANLNIKAAYVAMPPSDRAEREIVHRLLNRATNFLSVALRRDEAKAFADEIEGLYFRTVVLNLYVSSGLRDEDEKSDQHHYRTLPALHPDFQIACVEEIESGRRKIRRRILSGTGGILLRLSIDKKGRAKFVRVEDATPVRLANEKMHRSYRTIAKGLRAKLKDTPECRQGGEVLWPISISSGG